MGVRTGQTKIQTGQLVLDTMDVPSCIFYNFVLGERGGKSWYLFSKAQDMPYCIKHVVSS